MKNMSFTNYIPKWNFKGIDFLYHRRMIKLLVIGVFVYGVGT
jgi:hypothetical protein